MNATLTIASLPGGFDDSSIVRARTRGTVNVVVERDPRAMNRMDAATKLVHARLEEWGTETKAKEENGYPASTLLGRVIDHGPMGASQSGMGPTSLSEHVANVDAAVARLWGQGQRCIKRYYKSWEPPEVMAQKEGLKLRQFQEVLRRSRDLIGLWLDDVERK